jgi:hypothetical protein
VRGNWPSNWAAEHFEDVIMKDVTRLKVMHGETCDVTTSLMLRDPRDQSRSFYDYYVAKHQKGLGQNQKDAPGRTKRIWPDLEGPRAWGESFEEWTSLPNAWNMQTRELLGNKCTASMRQPGWNVDATTGARAKPMFTAGADPNASDDDDAKTNFLSDKMSENTTTEDDAATTSGCDYLVTGEDYARAAKTVEAFDVVGVVDAFDSFLLRLGASVGISHEKLRYVRSNVKKEDEDNGGDDAGVTSSSTTKTTKTTHPRSMVYDERLYALAKKVRPISHWFPYDPVRVVNAVP